jgi:hypothetical protein
MLDKAGDGLSAPAFMDPAEPAGTSGGPGPRWVSGRGHPMLGGQHTPGAPHPEHRTRRRVRKMPLTPRRRSEKPTAARPRPPMDAFAARRRPRPYVCGAGARVVARHEIVPTAASIRTPRSGPPRLSRSRHPRRDDVVQCPASMAWSRRSAPCRRGRRSDGRRCHGRGARPTRWKHRGRGDRARCPGSRRAVTRHAARTRRW